MGKKFEVKVQVKNSKERYYPRKVNMIWFYNSYYQINDILKLNPKKVLIIWWGNYLEKWYFENLWIEVITIDIDPVLKPDYLKSVTEINEIWFKDKEFDVILASHILEHIPFEFINWALEEFVRISKYSVIYLPYAKARFWIRFNIWLLGEFGFNIDIPIFFWKKHKFNWEHYWEIWTKWYSTKFMKNFFGKHFEILKEYSNKYWSYSYNYILKSKK